MNQNKFIHAKSPLPRDKSICSDDAAIREFFVDSEANIESTHSDCPELESFNETPHSETHMPVRTKLDTVVQSLYAIFYQHLNKSRHDVQFIQPMVSVLDWKDMYDIQQASAKLDFRIANIEPVSHRYIAPLSFGLPDATATTVYYKKRQGVWKVTFSDESYAIFACFTYGMSGYILSIFLAEEDVLRRFLLLRKEIEKKSQQDMLMPMTGIYNIAMSQVGMQYVSRSDFSTMPIIHPMREVLEQDIQYFYANLEVFTENNQTGIRKILLVGPPGTGKTGIGYMIAQQYSLQMPVVFTTGLDAVAKHISNCSERNQASIVIINDVESVLSTRNSSSSDILNFLDGTLLPRVEHGVYCIFTTNHPSKIETRFARPGRIDKIISWGRLHGQYVIDCLELYLKHAIAKSEYERYLDLCEGMTGSQIRTLCQTALMQYKTLGYTEITIDYLQQLKTEFESVSQLLREDDQDDGLYKSEKKAISNCSYI